MNTVQNVIVENGTILNSKYMIEDIAEAGNDENVYDVIELSTGDLFIMHEYCPADLIVRDTDMSDEIKPRPECFTEYICGMYEFVKKYNRRTHNICPEPFFENNTVYVVERLN